MVTLAGGLGPGIACLLSALGLAGAAPAGEAAGVDASAAPSADSIAAALASRSGSIADHLLAPPALSSAAAPILFNQDVDAQGGRQQEVSGSIDRLQFRLDFRYLFGQIDGFVQTPSGGAPGTTSHNRPTFSELGFDNVSMLDGSVTARFDEHTLILGGQIIRLDGSATLEHTLITQSTTFPAGTRVNSQVQLDWYRFGYEYAFEFDLGDDASAGRFRLAPGVEGVLLDFDYEASAAGGLHAHRSYAKAGVQIGGSAEWQTRGRLSIAADGFWGLPIDNTAQILSVDLLAKYRLWGGRPGAWNSGSFGGDAYIGIGFERIEYEDTQTVTNHVRADLGPLLIAGIEIRF